MWIICHRGHSVWKLMILYSEMGTSSLSVNLTHCDLVRPCGDTDRDLCQHWLTEGFVACWHQVIVWTDADSLGSCNVLRASLGLKMLNVLNDSWSVSVLIYMLYALWGLIALNVYYMTHRVSVCLFSVVNVCYMTHGVSVCWYIYVICLIESKSAKYVLYASWWSQCVKCVICHIGPQCVKCVIYLIGSCWIDSAHGDMVSIGLGSGLLTDGTKPLPEWVLNQ